MCRIRIPSRTLYVGVSFNFSWMNFPLQLALCILITFCLQNFIEITHDMLLHETADFLKTLV